MAKKVLLKISINFLLSLFCGLFGVNCVQAVYYQQISWDHPGLKGFFHFYQQKQSSQLYWIVGSVERYEPKLLLKTPLYPRTSAPSSAQVKEYNAQIEQEKEVLRLHQNRFIAKPGKKIAQNWQKLQTQSFSKEVFIPASNIKEVWDQFFNHSLAHISLAENPLQAVFILKPSNGACEMLNDWHKQFPEQKPTWFWSGFNLPEACGRLLLKLLNSGANIYWNALPDLAISPYDTRVYSLLGQKFDLFSWAGTWPLNIPRDVRLFQISRDQILPSASNLGLTRQKNLENKTQVKGSKGTKGKRNFWIKFIQDGTEWRPNSEISFYFMGHAGNWDGYGQKGQIDHQLEYLENQATSSPTLLKVKFRNEEGTEDSHLLIPSPIFKQADNQNLDQDTEQSNEYYQKKKDPFVKVPAIKKVSSNIDQDLTLLKLWIKEEHNPYLSSQFALLQKLPWSAWYKSPGVPASELSRLQIAWAKKQKPLLESEDLSFLLQSYEEMEALLNLYYQSADIPPTLARAGNIFSALVDYYKEHPEIKSNRLLYEEKRSELFKAAKDLPLSFSKYLMVQKPAHIEKIKAWDFAHQDWRLGDLLSVLEVVLLSRPVLAKIVLGELLCQDNVSATLVGQSLSGWAKRIITRELWNQKRFPYSKEFQSNWIIQESDLLAFQPPLPLLNILRPKGILYGRNSNSTLGHTFHLLYKISMYPFKEKIYQNVRFDSFLRTIFLRSQYLPEHLNCQEVIERNRKYKPGLLVRAIFTHDSLINPTHLPVEIGKNKVQINAGYTNRLELGHSLKEDAYYWQQGNEAAVDNSVP